MLKIVSTQTNHFRITNGLLNGLWKRTDSTRHPSDKKTQLPKKIKKKRILDLDPKIYDNSDEKKEKIKENPGAPSSSDNP